MVSSISKKYTKALVSSLSSDELQKSYESLSKISNVIKLPKFQDIINSKEVSLKEKVALIAEISENNEAKLKNFLELLLKAKRVEIIPAVAEEIREFLAAKSGKAAGTVTASFDVDSEDINEIAKALGSKLQRDIELSFTKTDTAHFNGIKVEIEDLGIEVEINKDALKKSLIAHILNTSKIF